MNSLFEFEGDVFAADAVAAVVVYPPDKEEEEEQWTIRLILRGAPESVNYYEETEKAARETQLRAVAAWKNALAQSLR